MKRKLLNKKGFSLAEMLIAITILLLATGIVTSGIPTAINAYHKVTDFANAQIMLTTTATSLRDELDLAREIEIDDDKSISYVDNNGYICKIYQDENGIEVTKNSNNKTFTQLLVSNSAASKSFYVTYDDVTYEDDVITFKGIRIKKISTDEQVNDTYFEEYKVRLIKSI